MIYAHIKDMAISANNKKEWAEFLLANDGKEVLIKRTTGTRSIPQNNYYFGVVLGEISKHTGHSVNELHSIFKRMFLPPVTVKYRDREIRMPGSTAKLNKSEMAEYLLRITAEAASMGITIPEADKGTDGEIVYPIRTEDPSI